MAHKVSDEKVNGDSSRGGAVLAQVPLGHKTV